MKILVFITVVCAGVSGLWAQTTPTNWGVANTPGEYLRLITETSSQAPDASLSHPVGACGTKGEIGAQSGQFDDFAASTQTTEWKEFFDAANRLRREGHFVDAEKAYLAAVTKAEALGATDPRLASTLSNLAGLFRDKGRYAEAVGMYHRSVAIYQVTDGRKSPEASGVLNNLALTYTLQGRYSAAEVLYQEALANLAESLPAQHADVASTLSNLGLLHLKQGRYTKAETLYRQALTMRENLLGPDHPQVGDSLNDVASALFGRAHLAEAEVLFLRSLAIRERAFGPYHPALAASLNNIAFIYAETGRYAESEPLYRRSLAIVEKLLQGRIIPTLRGPQQSGTAMLLARALCGIRTAP